MAVVWLLILLVLAIVLVRLITYLVRGRRQPRITAPSCGNCHYQVTGLQGTTCPECGSNLLDVGVLTPGQRSGRSTLLQKLTWWTAVVFLAGWFLTNPIFEFLPTMYVWQGSTRVTFQSPASDAYQHINLVQQFRDVRGGKRLDAPVRLRVFKHDGRGPVDAIAHPDDQTMRIVKSDGSKSKSMPLSTKNLTAWLKRNGIDVTPAEFEVEADELMVTLTDPIVWQRLLPQRGGSYSRGSVGSSGLGAFGSSRENARGRSVRKWQWYHGAVVSMWPIIWVFGVIHFVRRSHSS